jgi:Restriction endonuclease S subunits
MIFFQGRAEFEWRYPHIRLYTTEPKRQAKKGDILVSVRAPVGDINIANHDCCIGRGLAALRSKTNVQSYLLYLLMHTRKFLDVYNGEGTVFGSINQKAFNDLKVIIPPTHIVSEVNEILNSIDSQIDVLYRQSLVLSDIRDILLPKLMSGEIEVPVAESIIKERI